MPAGTRELANFIQSRVNLPEGALETIVSNFEELVVPKNRLLVRKGQVVTSYYFISKGGLRIFFDNKGKEITAWLAFENEFFTELSSLKSGSPTKFSIRAIENCTVLKIERSKMERLYQEFPCWQQFGRQNWEEAFLKVIDAVLSYQTMTAEERYLKMLQQSDLVRKIPLKQLASYLGITPTSLSRLRKKIS